MISDDGVRTLKNGFISLDSPPESIPQPDVTSQTFNGSAVDSKVDNLDVSKNIVDQLILDDILTKDEYEYCNIHGSAAEVCRCDNDHVTRKEYQIDTDTLAKEWAESLDQKGPFQVLQSEKLDADRWEVRVNFGKHDLRFQLLFSQSAIHEYDFDKYSLEFGIAFLHQTFVPDKEYIFDWALPLEDTDSFKSTLEKVIRQYERDISATIIDKGDLGDFRRKVRNQIRDYLKKEDYQPFTEISKCYGLNFYDIDPIGDDLLLQKKRDDLLDEILICRCETGEGYHLHRFIDGKIVSVEDEPKYNHMIIEMERNIDNYLDIQTKKKSGTKITNLLAGFASTLTTLVFVDGLFNISGIFSDYLPNVLKSGEVALAVILVNVTIIGLIAFLIFKPYLDGLLFSWDIPDFKGS